MPTKPNPKPVAETTVEQWAVRWPDGGYWTGTKQDMRDRADTAGVENIVRVRITELPATKPKARPKC